MEITCYIITISDRGYRGEREDKSGQTLQNLLSERGFKVVKKVIVPDEEPLITRVLLEACDTLKCNIVLTTGGTGLSPRDITPDVTKKLLDYEIPGITEAMRLEGLKSTPFAMLSRACAGVRGKSIVINLPGSVRGARESLLSVIDAFEHAVSKLLGSDEECGKN